MENFDREIDQLIHMLEDKDARGIDKFLYRYQEMGMGMLFVALYHALRNLKEENSLPEKN